MPTILILRRNTPDKHSKHKLLALIEICRGHGSEYDVAIGLSVQDCILTNCISGFQSIICKTNMFVHVLPNTCSYYTIVSVHVYLFCVLIDITDFIVLHLNIVI